MTIQRVPPDEAAALLEQGFTYVDVRSVPEFGRGHPAGAYNVPFQHKTARGMTPNPEFLATMKAAFPADAKLVLGCGSGARSRRAAELLASNGYTGIVDMRGGFSGERDAAGRVACEGWEARGLPVATQAEPGRAYDDIKPGD